MPVNPSHLEALQAFFQKPIAQQGTSPLSNGTTIAVYLDNEGPVTLTRFAGKAVIEDKVPAKPDMTFWVPGKALEHLNSQDWKSVGEVGIEIVKLMVGDEAAKVKAKVHIGPFDLFRHGYLGVVTLGGPSFLQFLASKGLTGIGKIKDAVNQFRS